jgi:conjugal transfer/entry exclusion protein
MTVTVREIVAAVVLAVLFVVFTAWRFHVTDPANWPATVPAATAQAEPQE